MRHTNQGRAPARQTGGVTPTCDKGVILLFAGIEKGRMTPLLAPIPCDRSFAREACPDVRQIECNRRCCREIGMMLSRPRIEHGVAGRLRLDLERFQFLLDALTEGRVLSEL